MIEENPKQHKSVQIIEQFKAPKGTNLKAFVLKSMKINEPTSEEVYEKLPKNEKPTGKLNSRN